MTSDAGESDLERKADQAFNRGNYDLALEYSEILAARVHDPKAYFTCGLIFEHGNSRRGVDLDRAYDYFNRLRIEFDDIEGDVGCARIIINSGDEARISLAKKYCEDVIRRRDYVFAHLLLGRIQSEHLADHVEARKSFLRAAVRGSAWAMRLYARSLMMHKSKLLGFAAHIIVTVLSPIYLLIGGRGVTRFG